MLVLAVKRGDIVWIGDRDAIEEVTRQRQNGKMVDPHAGTLAGRLAAIQVLESRNGKVKLGFAAHPKVRILRDNTMT